MSGADGCLPACPSYAACALSMETCCANQQSVALRAASSAKPPFRWSSILFCFISPVERNIDQLNQTSKRKVSKMTTFQRKDGSSLRMQEPVLESGRKEIAVGDDLPYCWLCVFLIWASRGSLWSRIGSGAGCCDWLRCPCSITLKVTAAL